MPFAYAITTLTAVHTALRDTVLDAGTNNATIALYDSADVLLATITLAKPSGSINTTTGQITLSQQTPEASAPNTGTADYAKLIAGDGALVATLPVVQGSQAQSGAVALPSLAIVAGGRVDLLSATIG